MLERFIQTDDGTLLFTSQQGQGFPLVLCDGIGCHGFIWAYLAPALASGYRVVQWHYRGHGRSGRYPPKETLTIPSFRSDLLSVLNSYDISKAALIGYSMGTQLVLDFALHHPDRVAALSCLCGTYGQLLDALHGYRRYLKTLIRWTAMALARWPRWGQILWKHFCTAETFYYFVTSHVLKSSKIRHADFMPYFHHLGQMDALTLLTLFENIQYHTVEDRLMDIFIPTLIIAGEKDLLTPVWLSQRIHALLPASELWVIPQATHLAPLEAPELIVLHLKHFLKTHLLNPSEALLPAPPSALPEPSFQA